MDSIRVNIIYSIALVLLWGCHYNDISGTRIPDNENFNVNCTLKDLCAQRGKISEDLVSCGVVMTSDSTGNFFREIIVGEFSQGDTTIMRLPLYFYDTYSLFPRGTKILIRGKGLFLGFDNKLYSLGYTPLSGSSTPEAIPTPTLALEHLRNSGKKAVITPMEMTIDMLNESYIGHYIQLDNAYFAEDIGTFEGEREICQIGSENTIKLYTSRYSSFAGDAVPGGVLTITALVEYYDGKIQLKVVDKDALTQKNEKKL